MCRFRSNGVVRQLMLYPNEYVVQRMERKQAFHSNRFFQYCRGAVSLPRQFSKMYCSQ